MRGTDRDDRQLRARNRFPERLRVGGNDQLVVVAPDEQRLCLDAIEPAGKSAIGNGKQNLSRHAELARVGNEKTLQPFRILKRHARRHQRRARFHIVEQQLGKFEGHGGEDVRDGVIVEPQAGRRNQRQARNVMRRNRCHLGRDHPAHGMSDKQRVFQPKRIDDIPGVQGEIEHIANLATLLRVAIARKKRCIDAILLRESREERIVRQDSTGAVQKYERRTFSTFEIAHGHLRSGNRFQVHCRSPSMRGGELGDVPLARQAAWRHRIADRMTPESRVALVIREEAAQLRHHLVREQLARIHALLPRHIADMEQAEDVADSKGLDQLLHALAHRFRRTGDDVPAFCQILPGEIRKSADRRIL